MKSFIAPAGVDYREVVRVAISNNFNCTESEYTQLDKFRAERPRSFFFINCNIKTPQLLNINNHSVPAVITVNPDLIVREEEIDRLYKLDPQLVAFVRVKYLPDNAPVKQLIDELHEEGYQVVVTMQRFNGKACLEHYEFSCSRYRLHGEALTELHRLADSYSAPQVHICDRAGLGCQGCGLCSRLTTGQDLTIKSLNLSSSGVCRYHCPDCYAKAMQVFLKKTGQNLIDYDHIKRNKKQSGSTKHIKTLQGK